MSFVIDHFPFLIFHFKKRSLTFGLIVFVIAPQEQTKFRAF